jgi:hypothetical protein
MLWKTHNFSERLFPPTVSQTSSILLEAIGVGIDSLYGVTVNRYHAIIVLLDTKEAPESRALEAQSVYP